MYKTPKLEWTYSVIAEKGYQIDIGEYHTYGIKAVGFQNTLLLHDVSVYKNEVALMTECFNKYQLSAIHLQDAVEDMLISLNCV